MGLKLYYFIISPPSRFVKQLCAELGIDVEVVKVSLPAGEHKKPDYLKICPDGVVPCIDDDGFVFNESRAIATYLCEKYGGESCTLYPRDPQRRAEVNKWLWTESTVYSDLVKYFGPIIVHGKEPDPEQGKKVEARLDQMEKRLATSEFLSGSTLTLPDLSFTCGLQNLVFVGFSIDKWPKVKALYEKYMAKPYYEVIPPLSELKKL